MPASDTSNSKYKNKIAEFDIQLVDDNKFKDVLPEMGKQLSEILEAYIDLRKLPHPYYNWNSLTDKWAEYDRCYEIRAKSDREEYEYKGTSNIMLPDFHATIEIIRTRELNAIFSNKDMFEAKPTKVSGQEDTIIAKNLVKHNFDIAPDFRGEVEKVIQDRLNYGTCFARTIFTVDEVKHRVMEDKVLDDNGQPILIDGVPQIEPEPYEAYNITEKKYTSYEHLDTKKVYIHTRIEKMDNQEACFILCQKSYKELLALEADGLIAKDMADYIKDFESENTDSDIDEAQDSRSVDDSTVNVDGAKVYDTYLVYFYYGEGDDRCVYEAFYLKDDKIVGLRKSPVDSIGDIIKKDCYITIPGYAYGISLSDEQYPSYISKNARFNQVFDLSSFEIKGGGFKDPQLLPNKSFASAKPGKFDNVPGLSALLGSGAKPILTWAELGGKAPSSTGLDVVNLLNQSIQHGTGATNLLAGMPSDTEVDKTATGIQTAISAGNERINANLGKFEAGPMIKGYADTCYENYQEYLNPEIDLPIMLDPEELMYNNEEGQQVPINFPDVLLDVDFTFTAIKRVVESEKQIGKMMRLLQSLGQIVQQTAAIKPALGLEIVEKLDWEYVITDIAKNIGVSDLDRLFPTFNPLKELIQAKEELTALAQQSEMTNAMIGESMNRLKENGNQDALDTVNGVMAEAQEGGPQQ